jgi:hypothetical protein
MKNKLSAKRIQALLLASGEPEIPQLLEQIETSARRVLLKHGVEFPEGEPLAFEKIIGDRCVLFSPFVCPIEASDAVKGCFQALEYVWRIRWELQRPESNFDVVRLSNEVSGREVESLLARIDAVRRANAKRAAAMAFRLGQLAIRMRFANLAPDAASGQASREAVEGRHAKERHNAEATIYKKLRDEWEASDEPSMLAFYHGALVKAHYGIEYERMRRILKKYSAKKSPFKKNT